MIAPVGPMNIGRAPGATWSAPGATRRSINGLHELPAYVLMMIYYSIANLMFN